MKYYILIIINKIRLVIKPNNPYLLGEIGVYYTKLGRLEKSIEYFILSNHYSKKMDLKLKPFNLAYLGYNLSDLGDYKCAAKYLKDLIEIDPNDGEVCYRLAKCYQNLHLIEEALIFFEKATKVDSKNFWYPMEAVIMIIEFELNVSLEFWFNSIVSRINDEFEKLYFEIWKSISQKDYSVTIIHFKKVFTLLENNKFQKRLFGHIVVGDYLYHLKRQNEKSETLIRVIEKEFLEYLQYHSIAFFLAREYCEVGINMKYAIKLVRHAIRFQHRNEEYHNLLEKLLIAIDKKGIGSK